MARLVLGHPYLPEVLLVLELLVYHPHPWYQEDRLPQADQQALVDPSFQDLQSLPCHQVFQEDLVFLQLRVVR